MKRKVFLLSILLLASSYSYSQKIDTVAVLILDHMSEVIGDLTSCSYELSVSSDEFHHEYGVEKKFIKNEVFMVGPDKMLVQSRGQNGHKGYWYDGEFITYYDYDENNYVVIDAPSNIIHMIDSVNLYYGIEFPAADFFYPTFTDDILDHFDQVRFLGSKWIEGEECFHILASNDKMNLQIWISNDAMNLPKRFNIIYKGKEEFPQYEATFSNWQVNPDIPLSIFNFLPPPNARQIAVLAKEIDKE